MADKNGKRLECYSKRNKDIVYRGLKKTKKSIKKEVFAEKTAITSQIY